MAAGCRFGRANAISEGARLEKLAERVMTQSKQITIVGLSLFVFWAGREAQAQSRTDLIESARTEKEAKLTPWVSPKEERLIVRTQNSLPYRLLTGEVNQGL